MIKSISAELTRVRIPKHKGEISMLPFEMSNIETVPVKFRGIVARMIRQIPVKKGIAYLTIDGKTVSKGKTQRRGGVHIDGNFIPDDGEWGSGGGGSDGTGGGWKVGEDGRTLTKEQHNLSYRISTGGMLIASTYPSCKGWNGTYKGHPGTGGDCSKIKGLKGGFILKANTVYYGNSQFLHESLPIKKTVHRTLVRITLPFNYPEVNFSARK